MAFDSVVNIAEGAGKYSPPEKAVYYTRSRASATECAAVIDVCVKLKLLDISIADENKALLDRIAQMLTKLIKSRKPQTRARARARSLTPRNLRDNLADPWHKN